MPETNYTWDPAKNHLLKRSRGVAFEDVIIGLARHDDIGVIYSHRPVRYPGQDLLLIMIRDYLYAVPHLATGDTIRLITIYPDGARMTSLGLSRRTRDG